MKIRGGAVQKRRRHTHEERSNDHGPLPPLTRPHIPGLPPAMPSQRQPTPLLRLGRLLLVLAVCSSLGLHWAALQAVAWTQMLVTYSQQAEWGEAVKKTFDGEHPCNLCLLVKAGQSKEKQPQAIPMTKKLDAVLVREDAPPLRPAHIVAFPNSEQRAAGWLETPPVPPPRA